MWLRNLDLIFNAESGAQFRLHRGYTSRIVQVTSEGREIEVTQGDEDEVEAQFELLAEELDAIDLAPEEAEAEEGV